MTTALVVLACLTACGGDDGAGASGSERADPASDGSDASPAVDEMALGDPCDLVPASDVGAIVGSDVSAQLVNVGDGLPGATCSYTVGAGTIALSITPDGGPFYDSYRDQAEASGIEAIDGLGDDAFVFQDVEVVVRTGDALLQLQVLTSETTAATGGVEIARRAIAAIGG